MVKPSEGGQDSHTYQQALDDFSITQLLSRISNYSDADFDTAWMHLTRTRTRKHCRPPHPAANCQPQRQSNYQLPQHPQKYRRTGNFRPPYT
jgi:hypothetical protein